jgi:hypothetical protein
MLGDPNCASTHAHVGVCSLVCNGVQALLDPTMIAVTWYTVLACYSYLPQFAAFLFVSTLRILVAVGQCSPECCASQHTYTA